MEDVHGTEDGQEPFPKESENKTKTLLDLVHTDVCRPLQTTTPNGKRYTLSLVDDLTTNLPAHKSEVIWEIREDMTMTKMKFDKKPQIIKSDRSKEYVIGH